MSNYRTYNIKYKEGGKALQHTYIDSRSPKEAAYEFGRQQGYLCRQSLQGMQFDYIKEITEEQARAYNGKGLVMEIGLNSNMNKPHRFFVITQ